MELFAPVAVHAPGNWRILRLVREAVRQNALNEHRQCEKDRKDEEKTVKQDGDIKRKKYVYTCRCETSTDLKKCLLIIERQDSMSSFAPGLHGCVMMKNRSVAKFMKLMILITQHVCFLHL